MRELDSSMRVIDGGRATERTVPLSAVTLAREAILALLEALPLVHPARGVLLTALAECRALEGRR